MIKAMDFKTDIPNRKIYIVREFNAAKKNVWDAYTQSELLDQWWAPHPYVNKTKSMNFTVGGQWHYCMISPDNQVHWCLANYLVINPLQNFEAKDSFCDENAVPNTTIPSMHWNNVFSEKDGRTTLRVEITAEKPEDIELYIQMGFKEGFEMGLNQLEKLLVK